MTFIVSLEKRGKVGEMLGDTLTEKCLFIFFMHNFSLVCVAFSSGHPDSPPFVYINFTFAYLFIDQVQSHSMPVSFAGREEEYCNG